MKKLCIALTVAAIAGCSAPSTTEINRPPGDTKGTRQLLLKTIDEDEGEEIFASASYSDDTVKGFGPGILITCNTFQIVNTKSGTLQQDTGEFIERSSSGLYEWSYSGPDTSFMFDMPTETELTITEPRDTARFPEGLLNIAYEPTQPFTNIQVIFLQQTQFGLDTILPPTRFDSNGVISPIQLDTLGLQEGEGSITIGVMNRSAFSNYYIHSIIVQDSTESQPNEIEWQ